MKTFAIRAFLVVADENADDVSAMNANNKAQHPTLGVLISRALCRDNGKVHDKERGEGAIRFFDFSSPMKRDYRRVPRENARD